MARALVVGTRMCHSEDQKQSVALGSEVVQGDTERSVSPTNINGLVSAVPYPVASSRVNGCSGTWLAVPATARPPHGAPGEEPARAACKWGTPDRGVTGKG